MSKYTNTSHKSWWLNRKSKLGLRPLAKAPPHVHGKPWYTVPPTSAPEPAYIEYAMKFRAEVIAMHAAPGGCTAEQRAMLVYLDQWLAKARQILHEECYSPLRPDLGTTEGLLLAASTACQKMASKLGSLGYQITDDVREAVDALHGRAARIRRERAVKL